MLIIPRTLSNNSVKIGDDIEVQITQVKGGQVKRAISASKEVNIVRPELIERDKPPV